MQQQILRLWLRIRLRDTARESEPDRRSVPNHMKRSRSPAASTLLLACVVPRGAEGAFDVTTGGRENAADPSTNSGQTQRSAGVNHLSLSPYLFAAECVSVRT